MIEPPDEGGNERGSHGGSRRGDPGADPRGPEDQVDRGSPGAGSGLVSSRDETSGSDSGPPAAPRAADVASDTCTSGVRLPRQARSRRTFARIVRAASELIAERGVEATTIQGIVDRADSSVGSFYARFDGKEELVAYLADRLWEEALDRWESTVADGRWSGGDVGDVVEGLVRALVEIEAAEASGLAALNVGGGDGGANPESGLPGPDALRRRIREDAVDLLLEHRAEITHPVPERAVDTLVRLLVGGAPELGGSPALVAETRRLAVAYLCGERGDAERQAEAQTSLDFFDVWG